MDKKQYYIFRQWVDGYDGMEGEQLEDGDIVDRIGYVDENKRIATMLASGQVLDLVRGLQWQEIAWSGSHYQDKLTMIDYQRYIFSRLQSGETYEQIYDSLAGKKLPEVNQMVQEANKSETPESQ